MIHTYNRFMCIVAYIDACVYQLCLWNVSCSLHIVKIRAVKFVWLQSKAVDMYPAIPMRRHGIKLQRSDRSVEW